MLAEPGKIKIAWIATKTFINKESKPKQSKMGCWKNF